MFRRRLLQIRERRLGRVVRAQNIDIHNRLEGIDGELVD